MKTFSERLSKLLADKNMTQRDLSKKVGVTEVSISRYISDEREPKADILLRISEALDTSADYLLGRSVHNNIDLLIKASLDQDKNSKLTNLEKVAVSLDDNDIEKVISYIEGLIAGKEGK